MNAPTLNWTIFDNHTPRDFGQYTVKYYTSNDTGGTCYFYINSISGTFGSGLKWSYDNATQELKISGSGNIVDNNLPWTEYESMIKSIVIGEGITSIDDFTFRGCSNLTSVSLPSTLTRIGGYAFNRCQGLTTVNFPENLIQIGTSAFANCSSLQNVKLPNSLRVIGNHAFEATAIKTIEIPSSMITIPQSVFEDCYYLETVTIPNSVRGIEVCAFKDCSGIRSIIYKGTKEEWARISISSYGNDALESATIKTLSSSTKVTLAKTTLRSLTNDATGIKVTWSKVNKASGYYIYRKAGNGAYKKIATVKKRTTVSYLDKNSLVNGTQYTYMVKAYSGSTVGTGTALRTIRITRPAITACTSSSRAITLKWRKNAQVTGYEIRYTVGASSRTLKVRSRNTVKAVIRNPKKGRTYTIRLRAYRTVSGKTYYSAWSAAKKAVVR